MDDALRLFEESARTPALRTEALIRGGTLLYDVGRSADALRWLERASPTGERSLDYVRHLTLGRLFDRLDRPLDAADAYGRALSLTVAGQRAGIGRAAALFRAGSTEEAVKAAEHATRMRDDAAQFEEFNRADFRFVATWLLEVRRLRR